MTTPHTALSIPVTVAISVVMWIGGAWVTAQRSDSNLGARMQDAEHHIEAIERQLPAYTRGDEFNLAVGDVKRELDEIRSDVKEIRRGLRQP